MKPTSTRPRVTVTADGAGVVSHVGSRLLADVADHTTLSAELAEALAGLRKSRTVHDPRPGWWILGWRSPTVGAPSPISRCWVTRMRCSGRVASDSTCWRLLDQIADPGGLAVDSLLPAIARARAAAREVSWAQYTEVIGAAFPAAHAAGRALPGLVRDHERGRLSTSIGYLVARPVTR